jgi:predicted DNA-binding transcriptional regulator AlpA
VGADERLWTIEELADYLQLPVGTIYNNRATLPPATKIGRSLRWIPDDVREWVRSQRESGQP